MDNLQITAILARLDTWASNARDNAEAVTPPQVAQSNYFLGQAVGYAEAAELIREAMRRH